MGNFYNVLDKFSKIGEGVDALVCDASFIGLMTLLPRPLALCQPGQLSLT